MGTVFEEIFSMQADLNCLIGRDTVKDPEKLKWLFDYAQALEDEVVELKNCVNWKWWARESKEHGQYSIIMDLENAKIEAIDILHFAISLLQICNISDLNFPSQIYYDETKPKSSTLFWICERMHNVVRKVKDATRWDLSVDLKGRLDVIFIPGTLVTSLFYDLCQIFHVLDMSIEDILSVYRLKHAKNIKRQENNYSVLEKTEDDNLDIKTQI